MGGRKFRASANVNTFLSTLLLTELNILVVVFLLPFPLSVPFFFTLQRNIMCEKVAGIYLVDCSFVNVEIRSAPCTQVPTSFPKVVQIVVSV